MQAILLEVGWVLFADQASAGQIEELDSGMIRVRGRVARTGVQKYAPWPGAPITDRAIRVYRPPQEVFADSSLKTISGTPITIGHPKERSVTADNWKKYAVGHNEGETKRVSDSGEEYIETSLLVSDAEAVAQVRDKKLTEISQGYTVELDWSPGVTTDGQAYDAVQTQIRHNHTALLGAGDARAGGKARVLLDSNSAEKSHMTKEQFKILLDKAVKDVPDKIRKGVSEVVDSTLSPFLDQMDEEAIAKMVSSIVEGVVAKMKAPADEEEGEEEEKEEKDETEEERMKREEEEKKKKESVGDSKEGADLAKEIMDSESRTLALIDARDQVRGMVPEGYDHAGKTVAQLHLDAIAHVAPKVAEKLKAGKASPEKIAGAFETVRDSRAKWVTDEKPKGPETKPDHVKRYEQKMNDAFEKSWGAVA